MTILGAGGVSSNEDVCYQHICRCCVKMRAGISVRVRIRVRDGVRISNRVRRRVKLVNYTLITALPIATSADPHIRFLPVAAHNDQQLSHSTTH